MFDLGAVASFAHTVGQLLGQGFGQGLSSSLPPALRASFNTVKRGPGRPPKAQFFGVVSADRQCTAPGCKSPIKAMGLCSAHYQAKRRQILKKAAPKKGSKRVARA
jgi:hypothetical protein